MIDQKTESARKELLTQRKIQLRKLQKKQQLLEDKLEKGYCQDYYKELSLVNYKIECLEARIAGEYEKDIPYVLNLKEFVK